MAIAVAEKRKQPTKKRDMKHLQEMVGYIIVEDYQVIIIKIGIHRSLNQMVQMVLNRIQEVINEQRYRNKIFE
mgnify:CR=1 FL=1